MVLCLLGGIKDRIRVQPAKGFTGCSPPAHLGREREEITITFDDPIPFMKMPLPNDLYETYLRMIPGDLLAGIYREHGARLFEQNVSDLSSGQGKVNRGIRDTILNQPEMFLAYNNGLCATAAKIDVESEKGPVGLLESQVDADILLDLVNDRFGWRP
jgi:hypothetical protein